MGVSFYKLLQLFVFFYLVVGGVNSKEGRVGTFWTSVCVNGAAGLAKLRHLYISFILWSIWGNLEYNVSLAMEEEGLPLSSLIRL